MSDSYRRTRTFHQDLSKSITFLASDDFSTTGVNFITARNTSQTIYVQRIVVNLSTTTAATLTFQDTANTPVVIGKLPGSAALGEQLVLDGGPQGIPLTAGKNLTIVASAAGLAGSLEIEAYQKLSGTTAVASA